MVDGAMVHAMRVATPAGHAAAGWDGLVFATRHMHPRATTGVRDDGSNHFGIEMASVKGCNRWRRACVKRACAKVEDMHMHWLMHTGFLDDMDFLTTEKKISAHRELFMIHAGKLSMRGGLTLRLQNIDSLESRHQQPHL
uniref:Uncharacterized protein n=1 Tax=Calcidiscus leptoporus TaxID=127549 RepID=A0A7S0NRQ8_9EUKA